MKYLSLVEGCVTGVVRFSDTRMGRHIGVIAWVFVLAMCF